LGARVAGQEMGRKAESFRQRHRLTKGLVGIEVGTRLLAIKKGVRFFV
jgi:hypothetical protein